MTKAGVHRRDGDGRGSCLANGSRLKNWTGFAKIVNRPRDRWDGACAGQHFDSPSAAAASPPLAGPDGGRQTTTLLRLLARG